MTSLHPGEKHPFTSTTFCTKAQSRVQEKTQSISGWQMLRSVIIIHWAQGFLGRLPNIPCDSAYYHIS